MAMRTGRCSVMYAWCAEFLPHFALSATSGSTVLVEACDSAFNSASVLARCRQLRSFHVVKCGSGFAKSATSSPKRGSVGCS